jgi:shikimate dehydrogenase
MKWAGLIGYPVAHSLSPRLQQAAFDAHKIDARYELWETAASALPERIQSLRASDMLGANITIPHKTAVLPWLDECDPQAARIGAVNTIVNRNGRLCGYNTDAPGFLRALREKTAASFALRGSRVVLLGSGGAARAAAVALLDSQVSSLVLLGRTEPHLAALLMDLQPQAGDCVLQSSILGTVQAEQSLQAVDVLINTTSVGLKVDDLTLLIKVEALAKSTLVMDMIFNPPLTPLLQAASAHGCAVLNGLSMLLYQGTAAFELWTGRDAPVEIMRVALGLTEKKE